MSEGVLSFVDNAVDTTTGTILLKGSFPNTDGALWPGEFVNARAPALRGPERAGGAGLGGRLRTAGQFRVRRADRLARPRPSRSRSSAFPTASRSSASGIKPGDRVVTDGQLRLRSGSKVQIKASGDSARAGRDIMNFTGLFIRRPVMTTLIMAGILIFGIVAYRLLPVSDLPAVDYPDDHGEREPAGREPGDDGLRRRHAAREAVLHHSRAWRR